MRGRQVLHRALERDRVRRCGRTEWVAGKFLVGIGAARTACAAGQSTDAATGLTACIDCIAGAWAATDSASCTTCANGKFLAARSSDTSNHAAADCTDCENGAYLEDTGATCKDCPAGKFIGTGPQTQCDTCVNGRWLAANVAGTQAHLIEGKGIYPS